MSRYWMLSLGILPLLLLVGCGGGAPEQQAAAPSPSPGAAPPPPPPPAPEAAPPQAPQISASTSAPSASFGLIPPVSPEQRLKEVDRGRANPFGLLNFQVITPPSKTAGSLANSGSGNQGKASLVANTQGTAPGQKNSQIIPPTSRRGNFCTGSGPDQEIIKADPGFINIQPEDAQGVLVSGIVNFASTPVAIVLPRGESLERTVSPGSTLSQGRVRVVSINSITESVTLEQYGKTVTRQVGEAPVVVASEVAPPKEEVERPKGPDGFGYVRGVMLDKISIGEVTLGEADSTRSTVRLYGTLCNDGKTPIDINSVKIQVQDAKTNNVISSDWNIINETSATLEPGQRIEFDFSIPKLRGRKRGDTYFKFVNWR